MRVRFVSRRIHEGGVAFHGVQKATHPWLKHLGRVLVHISALDICLGVVLHFDFSHAFAGVYKVHFVVHYRCLSKNPSFLILVTIKGSVVGFFCKLQWLYILHKINPL